MLPIGGFILVYWLWCLRPLLIGPELIFPASVPSNARRVIEARYPRPSFSFKEALDLARQPLRKRPRVQFKHWMKPDGRHHSVHVPYGLAYEFVTKDEEWTFVREARLASIH